MNGFFVLANVRLIASRVPLDPKRRTLDQTPIRFSDLGVNILLTFVTMAAAIAEKRRPRLFEDSDAISGD